MTTASADYVRRLPASAAPERVRVRFYLRYATSSDAIVSADAHLNLSYSEFPEIVRNRDVLSRQALRKCFQSSTHDETQQGFFGMLLGLVGTEADQSLLEARIVKPAADSESGDFSLEGTLFGYLWLARTNGVDLVERRLITDSATFHQRYATLSAVSRLARESGDAVLRVRCLKTIRLLLKDPEIADLGVSHLQRLKDWSALDDVLRLYFQDESVSATKRAVVRYLIACRDHGRREQPLPQPSRDAERYLEGLRRMDARFVADVERFVY